MLCGIYSVSNSKGASCLFVSCLDFRQSRGVSRMAQRVRMPTNMTHADGKWPS